jgi:hypothetical protein
VNKDNLSQILDSLKPTKKVNMHPALQNVSVEPSPRLDKKKLALLNSKNSPPSDNVPLGMSDAAMNKRLKNLEEFINSKKRLRDREDAVSVASQVLDHMSKAEGGRS